MVLASLTSVIFHVTFADGEYESDREDEELFELESRMSTP